MKKLIIITALVLIYILLCGKSCKDDRYLILRQETEAEAAKDSVRNEFDTDYLNEESRYAAEVIATQKLKDFADYFTIYSDISIDSTFREKAGEMIRDIFISDDILISLPPLESENASVLTLDKLLNRHWGKDILSFNMIYDSIRIIDPMHRTGHEIYTSRLTGYQKIISYYLTDTSSTHLIPVIVDIIATRQQKVFGNDTLMPWVVNLGNITASR
jgi:hypothetical protein